MYCVVCWNTDTKVIDSRVSEDGKTIRRRRECENCNNRFTTFEKVEIMTLVVEKLWDKKEKYNRDKLEDSILKAVNKRKISIHIINDIIRQLELKWINKKVISSKEIWEEVLKALLVLDEVAYIRYASVHLNFESAKDFVSFINKNIGG